MPVELKAAAERSAVSSGPRPLMGDRDKARRIVDAMRRCVATRGIAGATFEHVSREAGVSRGLLHYYFGTKERLLIEVLRRDAEMRISTLDQPLADAQTVAEVLRRKEAEGVLSLRYDAEACVTYMFAAADGSALQRLTDTDRDFTPIVGAAAGVARFLLAA